MKPLAGMATMKPMAPMDMGEPWWPKALGRPATSGGQTGARYAFFPDARRLLIEEDGRITAYDSAGRHIAGVSQQSHGALTFTSQDGPVDLNQLTRVSLDTTT